MRLPCNNLDQCLRRLPDSLLLAIGLAIVAGIAAFRLTIGHDIPVVDFPLIAIVGVGWYAASRRCGYAVAVVAAAASVAIAVRQSHAQVGAAVASGAARLALCFVVLGLLGLMRRDAASEVSLWQRSAGSWVPA